MEQVRTSIGEMRAGTVGPGSTMAQLVVLLDAAARIGAAIVALCEVAPPAGAARPAAMAEFAHACRAVAGVLLDGKGEPPLADLRRRLGTARAEAGTMQDRADLLAWAQALRGRRYACCSRTAGDFGNCRACLSPIAFPRVRSLLPLRKR